MGKLKMSDREKLKNTILDQEIFLQVAEFARTNPAQLMQIPQVRNLVARERFKRLAAEGVNSGKGGDGDHSIKGAFAHNFEVMAKMTTLDRPMLLTAPLLAIDEISKNRSAMKVLCIGPRTEGEILNLFALGFSPENVSAVDLFTYSPWVDIGDMHELPYPDESFDLVLVGWVFAYSAAPEKAAAEITRVSKPGAYVSVGCEYHPLTLEEYRAQNNPNEHMMFKTTADITNLFGTAVGQICFRGEIAESEKGNIGNIITVFTLKNPD